MIIIAECISIRIFNGDSFSKRMCVHMYWLRLETPRSAPAGQLSDSCIKGRLTPMLQLSYF